MSNKEDLKNKIKKPTPTQAFLNQYDNINNNNNNNINNDIYDNNIDNNQNVDDYFIQLAAGSTKRKQQNKVFTSFYMDPDLAPLVDKLAKRGGRGEKSRLINNAIRKALTEYGFLNNAES